jgi:hypothetical protein
VQAIRFSSLFGKFLRTINPAGSKKTDRKCLMASKKGIVSSSEVNPYMFLLVLKLLEMESSKYTSDRRHKKTGEKSFLHSSPAA